MNKGLKYIIYDRSPIIFSSVLQHVDIFASMGGEIKKLSGAGYVKFINGRAKVSGASYSLHMGSSQQDEDFINTHHNI